MRDFKLTGRLPFNVLGLPYLIGPIGRTWSDGKHQWLENCGRDFIIGRKVAAAAIKKERREFAERQRQWDEERKREEEERREAAEHKRKAEFVTELMQSREQAERLKEFVMA